ncbi:MAG: hypothetical protein R2751_17220 [Bacteroidales bacterium]
MPVTLSRINLVKAWVPCSRLRRDKPFPSSEVHRTLCDRTNPTWPTTWFVPRLTDNASSGPCIGVMARWGANHGAFASDTLAPT